MTRISKFLIFAAIAALLVAITLGDAATGTFAAGLIDSPDALLLASVSPFAVTKDDGPVLAKLTRELTRLNDETATSLQEIATTVFSLEQQVAEIKQCGGGTSFAGSGLSIGTMALQSLQDHPHFQQVSQTAAKGMKLGTFEIRTDVAGGIRAALTNESGSGQGVGSTIPSRPDFGGYSGPVVPSPRLLDALPVRPTSRDAVEFIQVEATGDAEVQSSEGAEKAEVNFDGELETAPIVTIAGHTTASTQVLADHEGLQALINNTLSRKTLLKLENQIVNGSGVGQNINGLVQQASALSPVYASTPADVVGEALVRMADAGFAPTLVVMNPLDWYRILLTRNKDDEYIFGSPTNPVPPALWNTVVVRTPALAEGTGLTIDTAFVTVLDREQVSIAASRHHNDNFTRNLVTILAELRAGLEVTNQNAVRKFDLLFPSSGP